MQVLESYIIMTTSRGENTKQARQSCNVSSSKLAKAKMQAKKDAGDINVANAIDNATARAKRAKFREARAEAQRNARKAKRK